MRSHREQVRLSLAAKALLVAVGMVGGVAFAWPLVLSGAGLHGTSATWLFVAIVPLLLVLVAAEVGSGRLDARSVALLAILGGIGAGLRMLGAGELGVEPLFAIVILGGRALGRSFGFLLGSLVLMVSSVLVGGVGPWLPFQVLACGAVGFFAGCLPAWTGRAEVLLVAAYGAVAAFGYGIVMDLWFWPFVTDVTPAMSFTAGAGVRQNLHHFALFELATGLGVDLVQATTNAVLVLAFGGAILAALRRVSRPAQILGHPDPDRTPAARA